MSGLLHRLAVRALGTPPTVRPVVGWPLETAMQAAADMPTPFVPESAVEHNTVPRRAPRDAPPSLAAPGRVAAPLPEARHAPARSPLAAVDPNVAAAPAPRAPSSVTEPEARIAPLVASAGPAPEAPRVGRVSETRHSAPDAPGLLPPQRIASALPAPAIATAIPPRISAAQPPVEETTEVHVTIGRIEVTAVHEPPPQRREPVRPRKPRSLEDYLARRQGRPS